MTCTFFAQADDLQGENFEQILPAPWGELNKIIHKRRYQRESKMKISEATISHLKICSFSNHQALMTLSQKGMPKTVLEILISTCTRNLPEREASAIATVFTNFISVSPMKRLSFFDENTSHIIGKEWHEIDYSGEGMTWQKQKKKYAPYEVFNFKTEKNILNFLKYEQKLPYFKIYY